MQIIGTENRSVVARSYGGVKDEFKRAGGNSRVDETVLHLDCHDGYMIVCICQNSQNCTFLKMKVILCNF